MALKTQFIKPRTMMLVPGETIWTLPSRRKTITHSVGKPVLMATRQKYMYFLFLFLNKLFIVCTAALYIKKAEFYGDRPTS